MGKHEISGHQVYELIFQHNDLQKVDSYCESDVLNTYWLFLKFELTRGMITMQDYLLNLTKMKDSIPPNAQYKNALTESLENELKKYQELRE